MLTMKARRALRRTQARGFSLLELMVVVVLIAVLAALAVPSMVRSQNDKVAFDLARKTADIFHEARTRAAGTGSAHLVIFRQWVGSSSRGTVLLFSASARMVDETGANAAAGPNPSASCRNTDWTWAGGFHPGDAADPAGLLTVVDGLTASDTGDASAANMEDIRMMGFQYSAANLPSPAGLIALCVTPSGATYYTTSTPATATVWTRLTTPLEVQVARTSAGGAVMGIKRRVIINGGGQPRLKSE